MIANLRFLTPPQDQGQIVEVSYAGDYEGGVIMRVHDRSDQTTKYYRADLSADEIESPDPIGLNAEPDIDGEWEEVCSTCGKISG